MKHNLTKFFLIFTLLFCCIGANLPSATVFADNTNPFTLTDCQVNIADIDKYNNISIYSNTVFLTSTELSKITISNNNNLSVFNNYGTNDGQITAPKFTKKIAGDKIAIYDLNRVQIFDEQFNYIKRFAYIDNQPLPLSLGTVVSMCADYQGNLFLLDKTNNLILTINQQNDIIQTIQLPQEQQVLINDNSKIYTNANGNKIAVINASENNFVFDISNQTIHEINNTFYNFVLFDCMDNMFLIKTVNDKTEITKYECDNYTYSTTKEFNLTFNSIDIDIETGKLYGLTDKVYLIENKEFFADASTQITTVDIKSTQAQQTALPVYLTKNSAKLYSTCVSFASSVTLNNNTKVVVLQSQIPQNKSMNYCMVVKDNTELFGYIENSNLTAVQSDFIQVQYKTTCHSVNLLSYPSQNAGIVQTIANKDQILTVVGTVCDYQNSDNQGYYEVKVDDKIAYVEQRFVVKTDLVEIQKADTKPVETNQSQFIAMVLAIVCLFVVTVFVCYIINKKVKN